MGKLDCLCGFTFNNSDETLWRSFSSFIITPNDIDRIAAMCDTPSNPDDEPLDFREIYTCPQCKRLYIDKILGGNEVEIYEPFTTNTGINREGHLRRAAEIAEVMIRFVKNKSFSNEHINDYNWISWALGMAHQHELQLANRAGE